VYRISLSTYMVISRKREEKQRESKRQRECPLVTPRNAVPCLQKYITVGGTRKDGKETKENHILAPFKSHLAEANTIRRAITRTNIEQNAKSSCCLPTPR
jgi:hypothetical protein